MKRIAKQMLLLQILIWSLIVTSACGRNNAPAQTASSAESQSVQESEGSVQETEPTEAPAETDAQDTSPTPTLTPPPFSEIAEAESAPMPEILINTHGIWGLTDEDAAFAVCEYDVVGLTDDSNAQFSSLSRALSDYGNGLAADVEHTFEGIQDEAWEDFMVNPNYRVYTYRVRSTVRRADDKTVSILESRERTDNTDRTDRTFFAYNYEVQTGRTISLGEVVSDRSALLDRIAEKLTRHYTDVDLGDIRAILSEYDGANLEFAWTLDPQGITVFFSPYELNSYLDRPMQATVFYKEMPSVFTDRFSAQSGGRVISMPRDLELFFDNGDDGKDDLLQLATKTDEYDTVNGLTITYNGHTITDEIHAYSVVPYVVIAENGQSYLYVECLSDNDYRYLRIYDLSKGTPSFMAERLEAFYIGYPADGNGTFWQPFTNPSAFRLVARCDFLGTHTVVRPYTLSEQGLPQGLADWYYYAGGPAITTKIPLTLAEVDTQIGEVKVEDLLVPAGTDLTFYRTDAASFVDMLLPDGRCVRVMVQASEWPQTVNGIDIESCFDGMVFAG